MARINSIQIRLGIGLRTGATLTQKRIAGSARFWAQSADKHFKDLLACPDHIRSDSAGFWLQTNFTVQSGSGHGLHD